MKIEITPHALLRAEERGTNEEEIKEVINYGFQIIGKYGRLGKGMVFDFNKERFGNFYKQKRVEIFYIIENDVIIIATVYVFYGTWEDKDANIV